MELRGVVLAIALVASAAAVPSRLAGQQAAGSEGPETVVFTSKRGQVTFTHAKHAQITECVSCHHESRPEKPLERPNQGCRTCHTDPAAEPMVTDIGQAMHDTAAKVGVCYTCHVQEASAGKVVPTKCGGCHEKVEG